MLFRKINDNLSPHVILSFIGTADSAYYCKMQDEETCCAKCSWCSILDVFSNWVNTRTSSQARKKDENMCRYNVYWLVLLQRACKPSLSACLKISLCSSENLARFKGSMALMSHNVVPVVLLGDRNEAHDNVPGWVPLRVSYCYGNGTSSPFFFLFYHSLKLLFFFFFLLFSFSCRFSFNYQEKIHEAVSYRTFMFSFSCKFRGVWMRNKGTSEWWLFLQLCFPTLLIGLTHIWPPMAFKVKWHERR